MSKLKAYRAKRDFKITPEPKAKVVRGQKKSWPIFVIQEHHASRLHFDFRLEADGILKSWAIPKVPVMNTAVRRLAIEVEDHPLDYASFHGTIPKGEYGAGKVLIWDHGIYKNLMADKSPALTLSQSVEAGHVEVALRGKRLQGSFALIRLSDHQWIFFKMKPKIQTLKIAA
jgi:bifunctional non-homologous end joining protein LigD